MKNSDVPSAAELFSGMPPLESVRTLLSLFVRLSQSMRGEGQANPCNVRHQPCTLSGVPVRRVFEALQDEEKERLARENGPDLEYVCMHGTVDASPRWQAHYAQILRTWFRPRSAIPLC